MEGKVKKDCFHCIHIRPSRKNKCIVKQILIQNVHTFSCENFKVDTYLARLEEKKSDEPYEQENLQLEVF